MSFSKNSYRKYCLPSKIMPSLVTLIRFDGFKVQAHSDSKYFHGACKMQASVADFFAHALSHRRTVLHTICTLYTVHRIAKFLSRQIRWTCLDLIYFLIFIKSSTRCSLCALTETRSCSKLFVKTFVK